VINKALDILRRRALPEGGFSAYPDGEYRPDATAWAVLAFKAAGMPPATFDQALSRLKKSQMADGRVCLAPDHPETSWPTPLAILAWQDLLPYRESHQRAINFLVQQTGKRPVFQIWPPFVRHENVQGWPWIENTFSWIEPTALAMIALKTAGLGSHPRVRGGVQMLLERQLPSGGWNYGNTVVFDQELLPLPDTTGLALSALSGMASHNQVEKSLEYLQKTVKQTRTPFSLGWALSGLGDWCSRPAEGKERVLETLAKQGSLDTPVLSLLITIFLRSAGL
jgi:hypothetical protein